MYDISRDDISREELACTNEADERERIALGDVYPYKTCVPRWGRNTVTFPKITRFNIYLLRHFGAGIVDEINEMLYDGQMAAVCGVEEFRCPRLTHEQCRIDPRMAFWRVNKCEFIADLSIHLKARVYDGENTEERIFTLYVSLNFCIYDEISYEFSGASLQRPDRDQIKLDDYLIPILNIGEVNDAAEDLWFAHLPEAMHDRKLLDPFRLASRMGLDVAYHRLYRNHKTRSVLYWFDSEILVTPTGGNDETPPVRITISAGTIVINENVVQAEHARLNVYHECFHDEYHWLFFQLQEMHNNDLRSIKKARKHKNQGQEPKNPLTILEWEAKQGARALMLPERVLRPMIEQYRGEARQDCKHAGRVYERVIYAISAVMDVPKYLVRGRLIQLGYWQSQGALNFVRTSPVLGHYIAPFTFSRESCPTTAHTFVISPADSFKLYASNADFRARIDSGDYVYVEGHFCLNDPSYVFQTPLGPHMTDWANRHIDECCLRFENVYEVDEAYEFRLNCINCDEEYNRHYIDFVAHGRELSAKEIPQQQSAVIASLPCKPGEALKALMKMSGDITVERMAERTMVSSGTVKNWRKEEYGFDVETVIRIIVGLHLPPWISMWFLQISGVTLQFYGLHMLYRNIIACHYMDTMTEVNLLIEAAGFSKFNELK